MAGTNTRLRPLRLLSLKWGQRMYRLSPHRPVSEIVSELRSMKRREAETVLSRCAAYSVADGSPEAMLRLALAYYVLTEATLDGSTMA